MAYNVLLLLHFCLSSVQYSYTQACEILDYFQGAGKWESGSPLSYQRFTNQLLTKHIFAKGVENPSETVVHVHVQSLKSASGVQIHPNVKKSCTALLASNLAEPTWISVQCEDKMFSKVLCRVISKNSASTTKQNKHKFCSPATILKMNSCLEFVWSDLDPLWKIKEKYLINVSSIHQLTFIFDAMLVTLPPVLVNGKNNTVQKWHYQKVYNKYYFQQTKRDESNGFLIFLEHTKEFALGMNIYKCSNGTIISYACVCDRIPNCPHNEEELLAVCTANNDSRTYNEAIKIPLFVTKWSSANFPKDKHHKPHKTISDSVLSKNEKTFCSCEPSKAIFSSQVDDLIVDCGPDCTGDEPIVTALLSREGKRCKKDGAVVSIGDCFHLTHAGSLYQFMNEGKACSNNNHIHCREDHPKCYPFYKICSYELDAHGYLSPCRNGGHLVDCEHFDCNAKFKCTKSYCISWSYICDNKWDCPEGEDEKYGLQCGKLEHCQHMFSCRNANLCIYFGLICDQFVNCPEGDDEYFCALKGVKCPTFCICHTWVVLCKESLYSSTLKYPAKFLMLNNCTSKVVPSTNGILVLYIYGDPTKGPYCSSFPDSLLYLHLQATWFSTIKSSCFQQQRNLSYLLLPHNNISVIETFGLGYLDQLFVVNLSHNALKQISDNFLVSDRLQVLSLWGPIECIENLHAITSLKFEYLEVSYFSFCCFAQLGSNCNLQLPWFYSCQHLLINRQIQAASWTMFGLLICFNVFCINFYCLHRKPTKNVILPTIFVNFTDLLYCCYSIIILVSDIFHGELFAIKQSAWRSSFACITAFSVLIWFSFQTAIILPLLSYLRYSVVAFPMKDGGIFSWKMPVRNSFTCSTVVTLSTAVSLGLSVKLFQFNIPTNLCMPFIYPNKFHTFVSTLTLIVVAFQTFASIFIFLFHWKLIQELKASEKNLKNQKMKESNRRFLLVQLFLMTFSNILCWYPANALYIFGMTMNTFPLNLIYWMTICVCPINSLINPVLFSISCFRNVNKSKQPRKTRFKD